MPKPKKRTSRPQPSRMSSVQGRDPLLIRQDYGYRDDRPGAVSSIAEFDVDRRRNPNPNPIIREANRGYSAMDKELKYEQGGEAKLASEAKGGMGASATEDLLERLAQYKKSMYGNKYEQGGEVKGGGTIRIAGQYAVDSIKTNPEGNQYVSMELGDGKVVPVFGDWETYGNPNKQGLIEDLDYVIYPLGDGTYALDVAEAEADMLRSEATEFARDTQAGPGASRMQDFLEKLSDRPGMGIDPKGRMRPVKKQR